MRVSVLLFGLGLVACSDPPNRGNPDANTGNGSDSGSIPDAILDANNVPDAFVMGNCPADTLCLRPRPVVSGATIPDGRLVVAFHQLNDDLDPYPVPEVTHDIALDTSAAMIQIPLSSIALPTPIDDYRACPRTCNDLDSATCDCIAAQPKAALAYVLAVVDVDGSGAIEADELDDPNIYGAGIMQIGAADAAYPAPNTMDFLFPEGIETGVEVYEIIDVPNSSFDDLGVPPPGQEFDLDLCVPGNATQCDLVRFPNLT